MSPASSAGAEAGCEEPPRDRPAPELPLSTTAVLCPMPAPHMPQPLLTAPAPLLLGQRVLASLRNCGQILQL